MKYPIVHLETLASNRRNSMVGGPFGSNLVSQDYAPEGVPVIRGTNLTNSKYVSHGGFVFVTERKADELRTNNAYPGDIVFTQRGTLGQVGIIPRDSTFSRFVISQSQMKMTVDPEKASVDYLYYYFRMPSMISYIENHTLQAGVPHINLGILKRFEVVLPPLPTQRKIAAILTAYDDLIETNKRRIALLEKMAEELYREWFVRMRFPGYQNAVLKMIPLREFVESYIGGDWGNETMSPEFSNRVHVIRGTDFENVSLGDITRVPERFIKASSLRSRKLQPGDLIVENSVNHISRTAGKSLLITKHLLELFDGDVICASFCKLIRPKQPSMSRFLELNFRLLFDQGHFDYFQNIATNGIANLQVERFLDRNIIPFSEELDLSPLSAIDSTILAQSIKTLTNTRDLLLPRLISGKLSVEALDIEFPPSMREQNPEPEPAYG